MNHDVRVYLDPSRISRHFCLRPLRAAQVKVNARVDTPHPAA